MEKFKNNKTKYWKGLLQMEIEGDSPCEKLCGPGRCFGGDGLSIYPKMGLLCGRNEERLDFTKLLDEAGSSRGVLGAWGRPDGETG